MQPPRWRNPKTHGDVTAITGSLAAQNAAVRVACGRFLGFAAHSPAMSLRIVSWNVNSIRSRLDHVLTYLSDHEPDVVCLQETKVEDALFPKVPFMELGYRVHIHGSKALCGVATLTRGGAGDVVRGFREGKPDTHCRVLSLTVAGVRIYNLYVPNGTSLDSEAYRYKLAWYQRLRAELDAVAKPSEPLVLVGDFNVAPDERDVWDPPAFAGRLLFTQAEHRALAELQAFGLIDCFRRHCGEPGHYSWYDYRTNGFARGEGMRIDLVLATPTLAERCVSVVHDDKPRGWESPSDHVPVVATFEV